MKRVLISWVGGTDLRAMRGELDTGLGPVASAVSEGHFDAAILLNNYPEEESRSFPRWLSQYTQIPIEFSNVALSNPINFREIYKAAEGAIRKAIETHGKDARLVYHLSPGTPVMAAVWVILGKTLYPAELIQTSREHGLEKPEIPFDLSAELLPDLLRDRDERLERLSAGLPPEAPEFKDIIHRSAVMKRLIAQAHRAALRSVPVLIEGETGTGKELLARAIHAASPRRAKKLVTVNCGAIPDTLVESILFGYEKGAFTGAEKKTAGVFQNADESSIFLDEIGELPKMAQVKLLRVLQEGTFTSVGGTEEIKVDVRIIAATNRDLIEEIRKGRFREDLFFRLAVALLHVPPLRDRRGDLTLLIDNFLDVVNREISTEIGVTKRLTAPARQLLIDHDWPGNVRELLNTLQRAATWSADAAIGAEDIRSALLPPVHKPEPGILGRPLGDGFDIAGPLSEVARHYLQRAMDQSHGNKTVAAELLGLASYQTLTNWLKRYGLE